MFGAVSKKGISMLLAGFLAGSIAISSASDEPAKSLASKPESTAPKAALRARKNISATPLRREWGIEVLDIHQTSAGYMLQFRYRVLDPKAAKPLFDRKIKPYLLDTATGMRVIVPSPDKIGQLRNTNPPETGRTYWMLFANPAKMIKPGDRKSVV